MKLMLNYPRKVKVSGLLKSLGESRMQKKGFQLEHCRLNCPKSVRNWQYLYEKLTEKLTAMNLLQMLEETFIAVHYHHLPKVCLAGCPNGCSQPNIKDFGISGYATPRIIDAPCLKCNACVRSCLEGAITLQPNGIIIDDTRCLSCGDCQRVCPSGTIICGENGWTLRMGGRVGRHPRFAKSAGHVLADEDVVTWICETIQHYIANAQPQERLTHFLERIEHLSLLLNSNEQRVRESIGVNIQDQER